MTDVLVLQNIVGAEAVVGAGARGWIGATRFPRNNGLCGQVVQDYSVAAACSSLKISVSGSRDCAKYLVYTSGPVGFLCTMGGS